MSNTVREGYQFTVSYTTRSEKGINLLFGSYTTRSGKGINLLFGSYTTRSGKGINLLFLIQHSPGRISIYCFL